MDQDYLFRFMDMECPLFDQHVTNNEVGSLCMVHEFPSCLLLCQRHTPPLPHPPSLSFLPSTFLFCLQSLTQMISSTLDSSPVTSVVERLQELIDPSMPMIIQIDRTTCSTFLSFSFSLIFPCSPLLFIFPHPCSQNIVELVCQWCCHHVSYMHTWVLYTWA